MRSSVISTVVLLIAAGCAPASSLPEASGEAVGAPRGGPGETGSSPPASTASAAATPTDLFSTSAGQLKVTPVHHGTVLFEHAGKVVMIDPWSEGKLDGLPKADVVLITDIHPDHFDAKALEKVKKANAVIVAPPVVAQKVPGAVVLRNGERQTVAGLSVLAVPMYNKKRGPAPGKLFHDKGRGNGYVLTFGETKVYLSGDTECIDEMRALRDIEVAFVSMNLPYTMPPAEAAECIKAFRPKVVFPYHFRGSNLDELRSALAAEKDIEVRIRSWY
jgi:L-ascorbate metabolism protein UlaG (beta-lactamase superfamily)